MLSSLCQPLDDISNKCSFPLLVFFQQALVPACVCSTDIGMSSQHFKNASVILSNFLFHILIQDSLENGHHVIKMQFKRNS